MIGRTLAHYRITGLLGKGGMGEVYVARDTRLDRDVALKVLPPDAAEGEERRRRFEREAKAVAALRHPNIVTLHSIEEADGIRFLTMELVDGEPLSSRVRRGGLDLPAFLEIAIPLADAVGAAHAKGITHRDLKPANILIDAAGRVMVLDFGVAKLQSPENVDDAGTRLETDGLTQSGTIVGTVHYMSPEQAEGKPVDPRSDVFSLGIVLYEMATGERPYSGDTPISVLSSILKDDPPSVTERNASLPRQVERILRRCLDKDPARRYPTATDVRIELEALRAEATGAGTGLGPWPTGAGAPAAAGASAATPGPPRRAALPRSVAVVGGILALLAVVLGPRLFAPRDGAVPAPPDPPSGPAPAESSGAAAGIGSAGRPSLAVFRFQDRTGDESIQWLSTGVPNMLLTGLAQTPGLDLISSQRIESILNQIGRDDAERIDQSILDAVAERAGAGAVVLGSIFKSGDTIRIDVQVEDIATGRLLFARNAQGTDVFPLVDELAVQIRDGLALPGAPEVAAVAEVTTPSIEAWRAYEEGEQALNVFRLPAARDAFERALAIDPDFALTHYRLAMVHEILGSEDLARVHQGLALERADRLPERQRLLVRADAAESDGKDDRAVALLEGLVERFPDEVDAYLALNRVVGSKHGDAAAGLAILERGVKANPKSAPLRNAYAYRLRDLGRYPEAIRELETYQRLEPDEPNPWDSLGELSLVAGQPERALQRYARALEMDPDFLSAYLGRAWAFGALGRFDEALEEVARWRRSAARAGVPEGGIDLMEAAIHLKTGRYRQAEEVWNRAREQGRELDGGLPGAYQAIASGVDPAALAFRRGEYEEAVRISRRERQSLELGDLSPLYRGSLRAFTGEIEAAALARTGRGDEALGIAAEIDSLGTHPAMGWAPGWIRGEVALARGNPDAAEQEFVGATASGKRFFANASTLLGFMLRSQNSPLRDWEARVRAARGDLTGAVVEYRELNTPGVENPHVALFEPLFVLESARLLDRLGDRAAARREYERFLEYWKDADDGLAPVSEARQYLGRG